MASARRTNQSRQRQQRAASVSSDGSSTPVWIDEDADENDDNAAHNRQPRPLMTPRTKRRSITHLHELVRQQKEERQQQRRHTVAAVTPLEIERKMESLLAPRASPDRPRERRLIQVAVRCRPRARRRFRTRRALRDIGEELEEDEDEDDDDAVSDGNGDNGGGREHLPPDSVVQYDLPSPPTTTTETAAAAASRARPLPAISVPSHVLALGGHGPRRRFEFDCVFPPWKQQRDVYDAAAYDVIEDVLVVATRTSGAGRDDDATAAAHATIVAYGQTGTGKTYTMGMLQHADAAADEREHGIIPRALLHILSRVHEANQLRASCGDDTRLVVRMSFLQIYLEAIQDLLVAPGNVSAVSREGRSRGPQAAGAGGLPVRLDPATNEFYVAGLSEFAVRDVADARALLDLAAQNRVLAATARNKTSSRSHTLLTISIKRKRRIGSSDEDVDEEEDGDEDAVTPPSTVSFVDLAGSERVEGALHFLHATRKRQELRIREAKFINRSLSALGSVIAALSAQDERRSEPTASSSSFPRHATAKPGVTTRAAPHIRFRDSQLTKLLQARLMNGQGRLVLIATIDDRPTNLTETLSTLKFASQCRRVDLSRRRAATADAARQQREEVLRKQVFAEVKTMYEEREVALRRQYDTRIAALEDELVRTRREVKRPVSDKTPPPPNAAYVALCSLVDIAQRQLGRPVVPHPALDTFEHENAMVAYVADLYRQLKAGMCRPEEETTRHASETRRRSSSLRRRRSSRVAGQDTNHAEAEVAPASESQTASTGDADVTTDKEAGFQALARFLFTSGMLQSIPVSSSDEEGDAPYSQLDE